MAGSIIVIGAGIAGLSAACYGQMNGYRTRIFELHDLPGGLCTSWKRKGYVFDGCIHWLVGSGPHNYMYEVWEELGAIQGRQMVNHDEFVRVEGVDGKTLVIYTNVDRLEQHLRELAPGDAKIISQLTGAVRAWARYDPPPGKPRELANFLDGLNAMRHVLPLLPTLIKYRHTTLRDFVAGFRDPFLREILPLVFDLPGFPFLGMVATLAWLHNRTAGYPIGGSLEFARAIERRYLALGGQLRYKSRVREILVEEDRAVGVRLDDGTEHRADAVISAADGHSTIFEMLGGRYADEKVRGYYKELPIFDPLVQVSLGVNRDFSDEPPARMRRLPEPIVLAGKTQETLSVRHFCYDPTMAPPGKSTLVVMMAADYQYWKRLRADEDAYRAEKRRVADAVIAKLEQWYPGITGQIEVTGVATPVTFERHTGNWQGCPEGWQLTTKTMTMQMSKTLPGLANFYMVGQWVMPGGGLPPAATSGRDVIQIICARDGKRFTTTKGAAPRLESAA